MNRQTNPYAAETIPCHRLGIGHRRLAEGAHGRDGRCPAGQEQVVIASRPTPAWFRHSCMQSTIFRVSPAGEQLRRFKEREQTAFKRFSITDDDWRNRE